jgi:hypothetical protein
VIECVHCAIRTKSLHVSWVKRTYTAAVCNCERNKAFHCMMRASVTYCVSWLGYGLDDRGIVRFPAGVSDFTLLCGNQNDTGAHPPSLSMCAGRSSPADKAVGV